MCLTSLPNLPQKLLKKELEKRPKEDAIKPASEAESPLKRPCFWLQRKCLSASNSDFCGYQHNNKYQLKVTYLLDLIQ